MNMSSLARNAASQFRSGCNTARRSFSDRGPSALISAQELASRRDQVHVIDASWFMPNDAEGRTGATEHGKGHIPGAVFFDVDAVKTDSPLPHMMPDAKTLANKLGQLGINRGEEIVVYDSNMYLASARVWLMLRHFGHYEVKVLDGGLAAWMECTNKIDTQTAAPSVTEYALTGEIKADLVVDKKEVFHRLGEAQRGELHVFDARPNGRFTGELPEPRPGLSSGHMPGAMSVPFVSLFNTDGTMLQPSLLSTVFSEAGAENLDTPIITTCGSGVSAPVINLALYELTGRDTQMYDGSWTEWASDPKSPIVKD